MQSHIAGDAVGAFMAVLVNHRHAMAGVGAAHAAGFGRPANAVAGIAIHGAVADDVIDLGLTEHFVHCHSEFISAIRKHRVTHGFARTHDGLHV